MTSPSIRIRPDAADAAEVVRAELPLPEGGGAVVLLASESAHRTGWGQRAALAVARAWRAESAARVAEGRADAPLRMVLADLGLEDPTLHRLGTAENGEGVVDVILYGSSLERVRRPVEEGVDVVATGECAPDCARVLEERGWTRLRRECAREGMLLLAYLPVEMPGSAGAMRRLGATVVLAGDVTPAVVPVPEGVDTLGSLTAAAPPRTDDAAFEAIRVPREGAREQLMAERRSEQRAAVMAGHPGGAAAAEGTAGAEAPEAVQGAGEPPAPAGHEVPLEGGRRSRRHPLWWILAVVLLLSLLAAVWRYLDGRDASPAPFSDIGSADAGVPEGPPPEGAEPVPDVLAWSVAIEAHPELNVAMTRAAALRASDPDVAFHVAPLRAEGVTYWRILAGPVTDSAAALTLLDSLVVRGHKTAEAPWDVREAPLAFLLGDWARREGAEAEGRRLADAGIPTHVVRTPYTAGPDRWRLYAGSFTGPAEAETLRTLLHAAGLEPELVTRVGSAAGPF